MQKAPGFSGGLLHSPGGPVPPGAPGASTSRVASCDPSGGGIQSVRGRNSRLGAPAAARRGWHTSCGAGQRLRLRSEGGWRTGCGAVDTGKVRVVAGVALVLLLAGCSAVRSPDVPEQPGQASPAVGCTALQLQLEPRRAEGAFDLVVTNIADSPCRVRGYPAASVLSPDGESLAVAPQPRELPAAVALRPNDSAYAIIELQRSGCEPTATGGLAVEVSTDGFAVQTVFEEPAVAFCDGDRVAVGALRADRQPEQTLQPDQPGG